MTAPRPATLEGALGLRSLVLVVLASLLTFPAIVQAERANAVVALDGTGDYRTIQSAIDAAPREGPRPWIILVKPGIYREKLFITRSDLAIVGEDRDSTRIIYPELRRNWRAAHPDSDWGCAVVNIGGSATNVTLANLTIHNNYGLLTGDHDHQFAVFGTGRATKISLLHCTVIADGGDTVSLWNTVDGMYYHYGCSFEGWVDFVCPRGWCYITDSKFYGHNMSASLWHDGSAAIDQKFVIRNSFFDGVPGFPLGRHHRDGQFYLIDCLFSRNMADRPIYNPTDSPNSRPWIWGERHYYANCEREGEDFTWFADNLGTAPLSPQESDITAAWTFGGTWDPESTLPPLLELAAIPAPRDNARNIEVNGVTLRWIAGRNAARHVVRLGTKGTPPVVGTVDIPRFTTEALRPNTQYYWAVDSITDSDTLRGAVWQFRTRPQ